MTKKYNILFSGWIMPAAHSYSCVNCFQLLYLYKNYKDCINFYVDERPYYNPAWPRKLCYGSKNEILTNEEIFKKWDPSIKIDLEYRITFPYDITRPVDSRHKVIVFYTSEFKNLEPNYFSVLGQQLPNNDLIKDYLTDKNIYFHAPSLWSAAGLQKYKVEDYRNRVITHGIDPDIIKPLTDDIRMKTRAKYNITNEDILLLNIGSMTGNKGISLILQVLNILVNRMKKQNYKLILKGSKDLYNSQLIVKAYLEQLVQFNITKEEIDNLINNHIILIFETISYNDIAKLYNASDLYINPYSAEGFNLTPLEALACGLSVVIPETGVTMEYVIPIIENGGREYIHLIKSTLFTDKNNNTANNIDGNHLLEIVANFKRPTMSSDKMVSFIQENYSWSEVSHLLFNYFDTVINK